ncbi:MAG: T9SS type A sorting domain-containing protein [Bacteroidetes bacterium]|nr:T9SS type A sorting domain-containing protein [Bacteroidota bacterium]
MKNLFLSITFLLLTFAVQVFAQNAISISPRTKTINIGESASFSVSLTVPSGIDASIFLSSTASISPSIINYPYTIPIALTFKTYNYSKRGIYTVYVTSQIGGEAVKDSCIVEVVNSTPFRIFNAIDGELRPTFITLDNYGQIYYSLLGVTTDKLYSFVSEQSIWETNITNPNFNNTSNSYRQKINAPTFNMLTLKDSSNYFFTQNGLYKYKNQNLTIFNKSNSALLTDTVKRGVIEDNGRLWLGTSQGLASLENYTITRYDKTNSELGNEQITALALDASNRLWIGTPNGLLMYDGMKWLRYTPQNSAIPAPYIYSLAIDNSGAVWMGVSTMKQYTKFDWPTFNDCPTSMEGLVKFDGTNWTLFNSTNSLLLSNYVNGLSIDHNGNLWIGTARNCSNCGVDKLNGCGLLKYDGSTWTVFNTSNSLLPDNDVQWVGADRYGNIWFVCKEMFGAMNEEGIPFLVNAVSEQPSESDGIHLFPNPTSTQFTLSGVEGVASVRVVNALGEEVRKWSEGQGTREIDVSNLANGLYFVSIRTVTGAVVKPIIVSH